jgi:hypothetical protein
MIHSCVARVISSDDLRCSADSAFHRRRRHPLLKVLTSAIAAAAGDMHDTAAVDVAAAPIANV